MDMSRDSLISDIDRLLHDMFTLHLRPGRRLPPHPDLTLGQMECLRTIGTLETPTMSELANALALKPNTLTPHVDALVKLGLVRREADPDDRRIVRVALTSAGRRGRDEVRQHMHRRLRDLLSDVSHEDLRTVQRALTIMCDAGGRQSGKDERARSGGDGGQDG